MLQFTDWIKYQESLPLIRLITGIEMYSEASFPQSMSDEIMQRPDFRRWLDRLGVEGEISGVKEGGVGYAYLVGNFVVKFTSDHKEADAAAVLSGHDAPQLAKVFGVKRVVEPDTNRSLYAIVQERINTDTSKRHRVAGQAIYDYLDKNYGFLRSQIKDLLPKVVEKIPHRYRKDRATVAIVQDMLEKIKELQDKKGFLTQDTHGANIGLKGRSPAFFDLGRSLLDLEHPALAGARVEKL